ncbi:hypothetical protein PUN28_007609 [Cardiocondyla obscurior]|uniref:Uncharacterized protein n=1 Tax=Cardiocondyla obscurior TaxID=286306 RepID=A0AAW2G673_9HYME
MPSFLCFAKIECCIGNASTGTGEKGNNDLHRFYYKSLFFFFFFFFELIIEWKLINNVRLINLNSTLYFAREVSSCGNLLNNFFFSPFFLYISYIFSQSDRTLYLLHVGTYFGIFPHVVSSITKRNERARENEPDRNPADWIQANRETSDRLAVRTARVRVYIHTGVQRCGNHSVNVNYRFLRFPLSLPLSFSVSLFFPRLNRENRAQFGASSVKKSARTATFSWRKCDNHQSIDGADPNTRRLISAVDLASHTGNQGRRRVIIIAARNSREFRGDS